jgi:glycosyltransferase involved in cell wall biosynthesis
VRIGFNAQIVSPFGAGVATYARDLLKALAEHAVPDEIYAFGSKKHLSDIDSPTFHLVSGNFFNLQGWTRIVWEQVVLPLKSRQYNVDVMVYPDHTAPLIGKTCPVVITIHDVAFLAYPETFRFMRRTYKSLALQRSVNQADAIVVVSHATKEECLRFLTVDESKIHVVHNGVDPLFSVVRDQKRLTHVKEKYALPDRFILFVGTLEPRKNVLGLVKAFARLNVPTDFCKLVIAGLRGWMYNEIFDEIEAGNLKDRVCFLGYVPRDDLVCLYNMAEIFVYPSFYEGFGFPPLEAMACGVPVITSNVSSMPEIAGDAAVLIDPQNTEMLTKTIQELLNDPSKKNDLRKRGLEQVKKFSWEKTASKIVDICRRLAGVQY